VFLTVNIINCNFFSWNKKADAITGENPFGTSFVVEKCHFRHARPWF
jgi:hypothetical protein